jgi:hypothetical protein
VSVETEREVFRRAFAADALLTMLESPGDKHDKVRAAVTYANLLIAELEARTDLDARPK